MARLGILGGALALGLAAAPAWAQQPEDMIASAKALMLGGRHTEARTLLQQADELYPASNDVDFLLGLLALGDKDYGSAIGRFRTILVRDPNSVRVRLELARAFYLKGDYVNATRQFQFARAGNPSPGVAANIDRFLGAIRRQKSWSYSFSVAVAPDTNINNGTSAGELTLFGLPFELSDDARSRSGVGLALDGAVEIAPRIGERVRMRVGAAVQHREYGGRAFDDLTTAVHAGPHIVAGRWDVGVLAAAFQRRLGGSKLNEGLGARVEATRHIDSRTALLMGAGAYTIRYPRHGLHDGPLFSATAALTRALTPSSSGLVRLGVVRREAKAAELASWSGTIAAGYHRDLPAGFSVYAEPAFTRSRNDATDGFFGVRRKDSIAELRLAVLNRRIALSGFTPRVGLTLARRRSNIDLYDSDQRRIEVGFTSIF